MFPCRHPLCGEQQYKYAASFPPHWCLLVGPCSPYCRYYRSSSFYISIASSKAYTTLTHTQTTHILLTMAITALKFTAGVALVAVPLAATTLFCRPSFANAINNHLIQEEMEAKRQHNYKTDFYAKDLAHDQMLAAYAQKGKGRAREFTPASEL